MLEFYIHFGYVYFYGIVHDMSVRRVIGLVCCCVGLILSVILIICIYCAVHCTCFVISTGIVIVILCGYLVGWIWQCSASSHHYSDYYFIFDLQS